MTEAIDVTGAAEGTTSAGADPSSGRGRLRLVDLCKALGGKDIVKGINLTTEPGEFLTLLGPSGCGKTTTLNMVAGHLGPDSGLIEVDGRDLTAVPAHRRAMGMVFQSYALFPHMTVADNVGFGLRMRRVGAAERRRKVDEAIELVGLGGLAGRHPRQLSGGQQQRAALARALVVEPDLLLLDEPFSNLDAQLRVRLREEVVALQRRIGTTTILVTHDQEEALAVSDRIAVMCEGRIHQLDTPQAVYQRPATDFVAEFIGEVNVLEGEPIDGGAGPAGVLVRVAGGQLVAATPAGELEVGRPARVYVRPEAVRVESTVDAPSGADAGVVGVPGTVTETRFLGPRVRCVVRTGVGDIEAALPFGVAVPSVGQEVRCTWQAQDASLVTRSV